MRGNCLTYALGMYFAEGCTGRVIPTWVWGWPPKLRFYYEDEFGNRTRLEPLKYKRGIAACWHALWFEGKVRKGN